MKYLGYSGETHEADLFEKRLELNKGNPLETMPEAVGQTANKKSLQTGSYLLLCDLCCQEIWIKKMNFMSFITVTSLFC